MTDQISDKDCERIADKLVERVKATNHNFWIDPEKHYQDHIKMREVGGILDSARSIFFKAFIGLVVIGAIVLAGVGFFKPGV